MWGGIRSASFWTSSLSCPSGIRGIAPAAANALKDSLRQRSSFYGGGVFRKSSRPGCADDRRVHARDAQGKPQSDRHGFFEIAAQKIVRQLLQPLPIRITIGVGGRPGPVLPGGVRDRAFGNDADIALHGQRQKEIKRLLIGNADGGLQGVKRAAFDGKTGGVPVTAVANISSVTEVTSSAERFDHIAPAQFRRGTAMELNEIQEIGFQSFEAALDASKQ